MNNDSTPRGSISRPPPRRRYRPASVRAAAQRPYDRCRELPRVLPLWPHELDDNSSQGRRVILGKLRRALRAERRRGISGHWTYDLCRHVELLRVYRLELAASRAWPVVGGGLGGACDTVG